MHGPPAELLEDTAELLDTLEEDTELDETLEEETLDDDTELEDTLLEETLDEDFAELDETLLEDTLELDDASGKPSQRTLSISKVPEFPVVPEICQLKAFTFWRAVFTLTVAFVQSG